MHGFLEKKSHNGELLNSIDSVMSGKIYLDVNDGVVITGCVGMLLAIEAVRAYVKRKFSKDA